jgi:aminoglycoside 6'-N-acetyltransferase I
MVRTTYSIKPMTRSHLEAWVDMGHELWPDETKADLKKEFEKILKAPKETAFIFLDGSQPIGFVTVCMRVDYVEGSNSSPVGYLEGLFVEKEYRKAGIGKLLVDAAEDWARKKGASEMGSDTDAVNKVSQKFHKAVGYQTTGPLVHFIKKLKR